MEIAAVIPTLANLVFCLLFLFHSRFLFTPSLLHIFVCLQRYRDLAIAEKKYNNIMYERIYISLLANLEEITFAKARYLLYK